MKNIIGYIDGRPIYSIFGGDSYGYNTAGDVLVSTTADGVDLNLLWQEVRDALALWNSERSAITQLLAHGVNTPADAVPQSSSEASFELASEFGEPKGLHAPSKTLLLGATFNDYDLASRFTWKFLRDATADQVRAVTDYVMEADNRLVNGSIMRRLFDPTEAANEWQHRCFGLWNADGITPPENLGNTFDSTHTHYIVSGASVVDSGDIEDGITTVREHGYGTDPSSQLILLCNPVEGELISGFKAGVESRSSGPKAKHDFIPSASAPAYLTPDNIVGKVAPADFNGLKVQGSYGPAWIVESYYVPVGYIAVFATSGPNHPKNVISFREHSNPAYQGLRLIPGSGPYPLQDSFAVRSFGTGVRHRGAAAIIQVKASGQYEAPTIAV